MCFNVYIYKPDCRLNRAGLENPELDWKTGLKIIIYLIVYGHYHRNTPGDFLLVTIIHERVVAVVVRGEATTLYENDQSHDVVVLGHARGSRRKARMHT